MATLKSVSKVATPARVTFPASVAEAKPISELVKTIRTEIQARDMVDNLETTWTGQCSVLAANAMAGKTFDTYAEASKIVADTIESLKKEVLAAIGEDEATVKRTLVGPDLTEKLSRLTVERSKVDNSLKSMKSVLKNALLHGETILKIVTDGGHILFRKSGEARGKTEIQNLIKQAKTKVVPTKSDFEKAMDAGATFARRLATLTQEEYATVMREFESKRDEFRKDEWGDDDDDSEESEAIAA